MHALMAAVPLRMARLYALDLDAEPEPPDREPARADKRIGAREGNPIIRRMALGRPNSLKAVSNN
jgi:hypothetical protein